MDKKICLKCSTENEGNYVFCKYCGAMLPVVDRRYNYPPRDEAPKNGVTEPEIDGISLGDMSLYVGKRPQKFIPKFLRMEATGQKIATCVPVLLLGLFFGFFGTAIWFFWRKMPKVGSIFLLCGLLLTGADLALNYNVYTAYVDGIFGLMGDLLKDPASYTDPAAVNEALNGLLFAFEKSFNPAVSLIGRYVGNLSVPAVTSLFALYIYKNKAVADIKKIKADTENVIPEKQRIALRGGCSGIMVLIPVMTDLFASIATFALCVL